MKTVRPGAMPVHAWWIYLSVFGALSAVYHVLPWSDWNAFLYLGIAGARVGATAWATRRHQPANPRPWVLLVAGTAAWTLGEAYQVYAETNGSYGDSVNLADACFLGGYVAMGLGLFGLARPHGARGPANGLIDAAIVFVAFAVLAWAFLVTPTTIDAAAGGLPATLRMVYPVLDLGLISILVWMGAAPEVRTASYRLMVLSLAFWAGSNAGYHLDTFSSGTSAATLQDTWLAGHVLWGTAVLMPSLAGFWARRDRVLGEYTTGRLTMLLLATVSAPLTLVLQFWRRDELDVVAVSVGGAIMVMLSTVRLRRLVRRMSDQSARLQTLALTDVLTGLPNRRSLAEHLRRSLDQSRAGVGALVIDLDRFKGYNDAFGHRIGDELLVALARRWRARLGPEVFLARTGGDEFTALVPTSANPDAAMEVATVIIASLADPVVVSHLQLAVEASIGVSVSRGLATTAEALLHEADVAMYVAKDQQSQIVRYCDTLDTHAGERFLLLNDLRGGVERGELTVHYQPQLDLATGRVTGVEALVRWFHPVRGPIPPTEFIPAAEKTGLIRAITRFVLHTSLASCQTWRASGVDLRVGVNVSARALFDPSFVSDVVQALERYGVPPSSLDLEITESSAMIDVDAAARTLGLLADLGLRLSVDDFGTGHSSLEYLQRLPMTVIKVDQSFVRTMTTNLGDEVIVRSTIDLARSLGMETVAEGVEDLTALDALRSLGCDIAQGYAIARPMPASEVVDAVRSIEQVHLRAVGPDARTGGGYEGE